MNKAAPATESRKTNLHLEGLDCADCAAKLAKKIMNLPGVQQVDINFATARMRVKHFNSEAKLIKAVEAAGYRAKVAGALGEAPTRASAGESVEKQVGKLWFSHQQALSVVCSGLALALGWSLSVTGAHDPVLAMIFYLAAIVAGGGLVFRRAYFSLKSLVLDINVLMSVAVVGAVLIGECLEGAMVAFLFAVGSTLERYTMEKTRRSLCLLMELAPKEACVRRDDSEIKLPVEKIKVGDTVIVRPGEKIAVDGVVVWGRSTVNQAPITGEAMPVGKTEGDDVYAGTINGQGLLEILVTQKTADTNLSKIINLMEEAQAERAPCQQFVERFARYYTPVIIGLATVMALIPPLFFDYAWYPWIYRGLALLVVACPCALVISTPVAIVSAIGNAARKGVLIKGGAYLEQAGSLAVVVFDKTGTLTSGHPQVTDILVFSGVSREEILCLAATIESKSEHPLAQAIVEQAVATGITANNQVCDFVSLTGKGVRARVAGQVYYIGNKQLMEDQNIELDKAAGDLERLQKQGKSVIFLGTEERVIGLIAVMDRVRDGAKAAIHSLREAGIQKVIMLSGDHEGPTRVIATELELDEYQAGLLPQDKVSVVKSLLARYAKVAMVGDGINDAPALASATVGIAMGAAGSDTALETSDITLMGDDLSGLSFVVKLSRATLGIIKQNIAFALLAKLAAVLLIFPGRLGLLIAVFADMGSSLIVTLNGMRLLRYQHSSLR